jgi:exosortase
VTFTSRSVRFAIYGLVVAAIGLPALWALVELSMRDSSASHLVLIPFVSVALIYREKASIFASVRSDWRVSAGVIAFGLALLLVPLPPGDSNSFLWVRIAAIVTLVIAGFLGFYGPRSFRAALFPLLFLAFMIPLPDAVLNGAVSVLKRGSTETVAILFTLTGTPFHREGYIFSLPTFVIEVADACSGIRSSIALVLTCLLAGHMFLRKAWTKAVLVVMVLPLTILKNGIRIVSLCLLATHVDPRFLTGQLHHDGGIVFFMLALALLFPVFAFLCKSEAKSSAPQARRVDALTALKQSGTQPNI